MVSSYPPPYGGVSIHAHRLRRRLLEAGHECTVWGNQNRPEEGLFPFPKAKGRLRELARRAPDSIFHVQSRHLAAGRLAAAHDRVVNTVHNQTRVDDTFTGGRFPVEWLKRKRTLRSFRKVRHLIAVSERIREQMLAFGFDPARVHVINAYLAPGDDEQAHPANLEAFEKFRRRFETIATANTSGISTYHGADRYGADMCIRLVARLKERRPGFGVALAAPISKGTEYLAAHQKLARELGVADRILWLLEPGAYHPIMRHCDLVLRPTNMDGFAITVAEACEFGVPVVASDVCVRPAGCRLFRTRDMDDFEAKAEEVLDDLETWSRRSYESRERDHFPEILEVYRDLSGG